MTANFPRNGTASPSAASTVAPMSSALGQTASIGDTSITLKAPFPTTPTNLFCVLIGAFSPQAEVRQIGSVSGNVLTFGQGISALANAHAVNSTVILLGNTVLADWFGMSRRFGTTAGNAAALLAACTQAAQFGNGYTAIVELSPGHYGMDGAVAITGPAGITIDGKGAGLYWATDLGLGQIGLDLQNTSGMTLRNVNLVGPLSARPAIGTDPGCMDGLRVTSKVILEAVSSTGFRSPIVCAPGGFDHSTWDNVVCTNGYYGIYMTGVGTFGNNVFRRVFSQNNARAAIGVANGAWMLGCFFQDSHFFGNPVGFYCESGGTLSGANLRNTFFEQIGNAVFYIAAGGNGFIADADDLSGAAAFPAGAYLDAGLDSGAVIINDSNGVGNLTLRGDWFGFLSNGGVYVSGGLHTFIPLNFDIDIENSLNGLLNAGGRFFKNAWGGSGAFWWNAKIHYEDSLQGGYACVGAVTSGTLRGDLLELAALQPYQTAGAAPFGVTLELPGSGTGPMVLIAIEGACTINVQPGNTIAAGSYLKPDATNHGRVVQATSFSDGPIIGKALAANNAASSGFGSANTVLARLWH